MNQISYSFTLSNFDTKRWHRYGADSWAGKTVNADGAMQLATFWACVRLISQTIGTLPLGLYAHRDDAGRDAQRNHPLYTILHDQPNFDQTSVEFWEGVTAHLLLYGNAFALKEVSVGQVRALTLLRPDLMWVYRDRDGEQRYRYADPKGQREYSQDEIFHVRGFGVGGDVGLSPMSYARQTLSTATAADEIAGRTFAQGMRPTGFFKYAPPAEVEPVLTDEQRTQVKQVLVDAYTGSGNAAKAGVLEGHFEWESVNIQPRDAELLLSRRHHIEEICRWFGVPPIMIGHAAEGQTMWGSGVEQIMLQFYTNSLRPLLVRIEKAIKRSLIAPAERRLIYAEFNVEGLLRGASEAQARFLSAMVQNGLMTRNDARARMNLPALPGGDTLTVQSNLVPLELLGRVQPSATPYEPQRQSDDQ